MGNDNINGSLNIYFPCKIKSDKCAKRILANWECVRNKQKYLIRGSSKPLCDLMDSRLFRKINEEIISCYIFEKNSWHTFGLDSIPYALPCLQRAYRHFTGDSVNTKVANVVVSRFDLKYNKFNVPGLLLCNINLDSSVVTYTITLNFRKFSVDDIIFLKHLFYKRGTVQILEKKIKQISVNSSCMLNDRCNVCQYSCIECNDETTIYEMSFQEYVVKKKLYNNSEIELDLDSSARFSLLEIDGSFSKRSELIIRGLLTADEGYLYRQKNNPLTSISGSITYDYFLEGTHGLISVNRKRYKKYVKKHNSFLKEMIFADSHVGIEERVHRACIAGVDVYQFPAFMKAVELHYLIRSVMSNDIVPRKQSYFNPCIFIKRGYRLWKIIYELDINQHHQYDNLLSSFEVYTDMEKIRCEYENILTHGISYFALIISIISSIIALT